VLILVEGSEVAGTPRGLIKPHDLTVWLHHLSTMR
jgi:hypothetical protein